MNEVVSLRSQVITATDASWIKPARRGKGPGEGLTDALSKARNSAWLAAQPPEFAQQLLARASLCHYRPGQVISSSAAQAADLQFLVRGAVGIWVPRLTGELVPIHFLSAPQWFGELGALTGRSAGIEFYASSACSALVIPRASVVSLEATSPEFRQAFLDLLSRTIQAIMEIAFDVVGYDAEKRVISKLLALSGAHGTGEQAADEHVLPVSQSELAFISSVSRPTINTVLARLEKAGHVKLGYRRILVLSRRGLAATLREER